MSNPQRDRGSLVLVLFLAGAGAMSSALPFGIGIPLWILAAFFFYWSRDPQGAESFVRSLPFGAHLERALRQLDLIISPTDQAAARIEAIRAWLNKSLSSGNELRKRRVATPEAEKWAFRTRDFITAAFGAHEAITFFDDGNIEFGGDSPGTHFINGRIYRISELLRRLNQMHINHDFDPSKWEDP